MLHCGICAAQHVPRGTSTIHIPLHSLPCLDQARPGQVPTRPDPTPSWLCRFDVIISGGRLRRCGEKRLVVIF